MTEWTRRTEIWSDLLRIVYDPSDGVLLIVSNIEMPGIERRHGQIHPATARVQVF